MIVVQVDDAHVVAALNRLAAKVQNLGPVMREIGQIVRGDAQDNFKGQHGPDGKPWKKLSLVTLMARAHRLTKGKTHKKDGNLTKKAKAVVITAKILMDTGVLRNSISVLEHTTNSVAVGTQNKYAATHQFGALRGAFGRTKRGAPVPWGTIPARPFLGISSTAEQKILNMIEHYVAE